MEHIKKWLEMAHDSKNRDLYTEFNEFLEIEIHAFIDRDGKFNYGELLRQRCYLLAHQATVLDKIINCATGNMELKKELRYLIDEWSSMIGYLVNQYDEWEMNTRIRKDPEVRSNEILLAAVEVAKTTNYTNITRTQVAIRANVSEPLVSNYFTMDELKEAIVEYAVENGIVEVSANVLANKHPMAMKLTIALIVTGKHWP